jgi:NADPH:quinone reductase-like Zn-dependent oxidoreductase
VIATGSARNTSWLRELGASEVIDYSTTRFEDAVRDIDAVIDLIGNVKDDTATRSLGVLRPGGIIVNGPSGSWATMAQDAEAAGVRATGFQVTPDGSTLAIISRLLDSGDIRVHVDQVLDLEDAAEAHRQIEAGHTRGKIVLRVSEG